LDVTPLTIVRNSKVAAHMPRRKRVKRSVALTATLTV
jgi:hypothetical protein